MERLRASGWGNGDMGDAALIEAIDRRSVPRDWRIALAVGTVEPLVQTVFFTVHDRIWARIERRRAARQALA